MDKLSFLVIVGTNLKERRWRYRSGRISMSWREHFPIIKSSIEDGDVISGCRDNDTRTYRLFVNKGWKEIQTGNGLAHQIRSCECCDLSFEDLQRLSDMLSSVIKEHEPWIVDDD